MQNPPIGIKPRRLDHLVLPTADLEIARARLKALGFTVAPEGRHPFGTANACVYFADGAFLEPLAVADPGEAESAAIQGNVFVARDKAFRAHRGEDGFSAIVFDTADAKADHGAFTQAGYSAGGILDFARPFANAAGIAGTASFRLAFAAHDRHHDVLAFTCQRIDVPNVDRAALQRHANTAEAIVRVVAVAAAAAEFAAFLGVVTGQIASGDGESTIELGGSTIDIMEASRFADEFSVEAGAGTHLAAIVFGVADLGATQNVLASAGIDTRPKGARLIVWPAPGQGAVFAFEAIA